MTEKVIMAGAGGQGMMALGKLLARAMAEEGREVTFFPSYGSEVRGGTAHCHLVISEGEIYSPVIERADSLIIMNQPSLDKFEERIASGGLVVINTSLVERAVQREDLEVVEVAATDTANRLGNVRVANIVALGAFVGQTGVVKTASVERAIEELFSQKKSGLIEINKKALTEGSRFLAVL